MSLANRYEDAGRASAYASLEFANTYYLAYRDLPAIISTHVRGARALDFGCGTGRSTRLLQKFGLEVTGVDIAEDMLQIARDRDPAGDYRLVPEDDLANFRATRSMWCFRHSLSTTFPVRRRSASLQISQHF